jgi:hypothetical protein
VKLKFIEKLEERIGLFLRFWARNIYEFFKVDFFFFFFNVRLFVDFLSWMWICSQFFSLV